MKVKTSELIGPALDWAVAKAAKKIPISHQASSKQWWSPSTCWAHAGPIIERERIEFSILTEKVGFIMAIGLSDDAVIVAAEGSTYLIAAMRCHVASKMGDEIEIPDGLCKEIGK